MNWKSTRKIKDDSSPDLNSAWLRFSGYFRKQNKWHSHPNIGLLKTIIEEEWNKWSDEFILKASKLFRKRVDRIIKKMVAILIKCTVYCQSYFFVYFLKSKLILFCNRVVYYYTRIFLILLPHPVRRIKFYVQDSKELNWKVDIALNIFYKSKI